MEDTPLHSLFASFLRLGATAYGGPAMMAYLRQECVGRRKWLTEPEFKIRFARSPILRAKRRGLLRNVCVALGNLKRGEAVPALAETLRAEREPLVRAHAAWALGQIGNGAAEAALRAACAGETDLTVLDEIQSAMAAFPQDASRVFATTEEEP